MERQTKRQAFEQVLQARMGSLASPAEDEYLVWLRRFALEWVEEIEREIVRRATRPGLLPPERRPS